MSVMSLFAGIGGFDKALEDAGIHVEVQCEIDKRCQEVLGKHFPGTQCLDDVRDIHGSDFSDIDIIVGGFPCQDISVAGHRAGLDGDRSGLWFEYERILGEIRPQWCVIENVGGLLSSNRGRDMGTILGALGDLGYGFAYRVLDAQGFGVPQRRRRVFIVGCLGDPRRAAQVLLEPESGGGDLDARDASREVASALTRNGLGGGGPDDNTAQARHLVPFRKKRRPTANDDDPETWEEASYANTLDAGGNVTRTAHAIAFHVTQDPITSISRWPTLSSGNRQGCATLGVAYQCHGTNVGPMGTLRSGNGGVTGGVPFYADEWGVRKLMPIECERLQGFPDNYTEGHSDSTRYKMLGNAVAVPVVRWIADRLVRFA